MWTSYMGITDDVWQTMSQGSGISDLPNFIRDLDMGSYFGGGFKKSWSG